MKVYFLDRARDEFLAAVDFYDEQAGLGDEFLAEIKQASDDIAANPQLGAPYVESTRRLLLRRFPFAIVYTVDSKAVFIVAVAHQRRKPGYWQE